MKTLFLSPILIFVFLCKAQITITSATEKQEIIPLVYDSLKNFLGKDVGLYKGQTLYLPGLHESLRKYGYRDFVINYKNDEPLDEKNTYNCCEGYHSKYEGLSEKYFEVLDIIRHPKSKEENKKIHASLQQIYVNVYFLKLKNKSNGDILYFKYNSEYESTFPFLVVGYVEKLNQLYINSKYTFTQTYLLLEMMRTKGNVATDINTGDAIKYQSQELWVCKGTTIDGKWFNLAFEFENPRGNRILVGTQTITEKRWKEGRAFTEEETIKYKEKFGEEKWGFIVDGIIKVGFTEEMVKLICGEPKKIYFSSYGEQWVYDDKYYYFENGKLTGFN